MTKQEKAKFLLSKFSIDYPYQSNLGWHSEEGVFKALQELNQLNPKTKEYWKLKSDLCYCIASNAIEQFSRGKYEAGMLTRSHFDEIFRRLGRLEERVGEKINYF